MFSLERHGNDRGNRRMADTVIVVIPLCILSNVVSLRCALGSTYLF